MYIIDRWEDIGSHNAQRILVVVRVHLCSFTIALTLKVFVRCPVTDCS
jgi:hypothetical protein